VDDYRKRRAQQARYRATRAMIVEALIWGTVAYAVWRLLARVPDALELPDPSPPPARRAERAPGVLPAVYVTASRDRPPGFRNGRRITE
jgi:hypothetical protein